MNFKNAFTKSYLCSNKKFLIALMGLLLLSGIFWIWVRSIFGNAPESYIIYPFDIFYSIDKMYGIFGFQYYAFFLIPILSLFVFNKRKYISNSYILIRLNSKRKYFKNLVSSNIVVSLIVTISMFVLLILSGVALQNYDFSVFATNSSNAFFLKNHFLILFSDFQATIFTYVNIAIFIFLGTLLILSLLDLVFHLINNDIVSFVLVLAICFIELTVYSLHGLSLFVLGKIIIDPPSMIHTQSSMVSLLSDLAILFLINIILKIVCNNLEFLGVRNAKNT